MAKRKRGNSEGSIYKMADGRWRAAVTIGKDKDGTPKRKVFTKPTRHEVQDELTKALRDQQLGLLVAPEKQTVGQFLTWWLNETVKQSARPKTVKFYEFMNRMHLIPGLGTVPLQKLTPQHVQKFLNDRLNARSERTGRPLSARSVRHMHRTLCTALGCAVKYGNVARNVALVVDPPRANKAKSQYMSIEQAQAFLAAAAGDRLFALFATVLSLGLRLGECLGIAWPDLDFETGRFNIHQALQRIDKKLYPADQAGLQLVEPKGGYSARVVTLPAVAISALRKHQAQQEQDREWAGSKWTNDWNLVFTSKTGTPLDERGVLRRFQNILAVAGLPKMRIHDLRHSAVAILIAQGVNIKAISELVGHSSVAFTLQVYGHLLERDDKAPQNAQALEFDNNQANGKMRWIFGTQCNIAAKHWDVWGNVQGNWLSTGIPCTMPSAFKWHHLTWQFKRTATTLTYVSFTLDGVTHYVNRTYTGRKSGVNELNVAFQMDNKANHAAYNTWLDNVKLTYW